MRKVHLQLWAVCLSMCLWCCSIGDAVSTSSSTSSSAAVSKAIESLYTDVIASQWQDNLNYTYPFGWGHLKGRFPNHIGLNFAGNPTWQWVRSHIQYPDDNGFTDTFILEALAAAGTLTPELAPINDTTFAMSLESALLNHDKYSPKDVPTFGFWPQKLVNVSPTAGPKYQQWSINLSNLASDGETVDRWLKLFLELFHMELIYDIILAPFQAVFKQMLTIFSIPMDADDMGVSIMLDRLLSNPALPKARKIWDSQGFEAGKAFDRLLKYSYCPASADENRNSIDPRSYFWARSFFNQLNETDHCLVTTWQNNYQEEQEVYTGRSVKPVMPFSVNNIDPTVCANSLFAMSSQFVNHGADWLNKASENRKLYETTARFVTWALQNQPNETRPDLEMLYYPPTVNLPAFVARHISWLRSWKHVHGTFPDPSIEMVYQLLSSAAKEGGTMYLQQKATSSPNETGTFWNGILGMGDTDKHGNPTPHPDDRVYFTATALNGLIDSWTYTTASNTTTASTGATQLHWVDGTPASVTTLVDSTVEYLLAVYNAPNTSFENTFFSGSIHTTSTFPWGFPVTKYEFMTTNETFDCKNFTYGIFGMGDSTLLAVEGQMEEEVYDGYLKNGCGGNKMTPQFLGFNEWDSPWPYWSSTILTKAQVMASLAKYRSLNP